MSNKKVTYMTRNAARLIGMRKTASAYVNGQQAPQEYRHSYSMNDYLNNQRAGMGIYNSSIRGEYEPSELYDKSFIMPSERC